MENGLKTAGLLKKAYEKLKASSPEEACSFLEQALDLDFENDEIKHALKCVHWWLEHTRRIDEINNPYLSGGNSLQTGYEKGIFMLSLLKQYFSFLDQLDDIYDQCQYAIRFFVYSKALFYFKGLLSNQANQQDPELLLLIGRCYKGMGNYDDALSYLEQAFRLKRDSSPILAEVADVNALLSDSRTAKTLFREAFFIDPFSIELKFLESALILNLINEINAKVPEAADYKDDELKAWIPVYGFLWGVFSVKRELKQMEAGKLKQSIFSMEVEYEANPSNFSKRAVLKPRLLNHYFWLIDYYESNSAGSQPLDRSDCVSAIDEALLKIKVIDPDIYKMYAGK